MSQVKSNHQASLLKSTTITESPANRKFLIKVYNSRSISLPRQTPLSIKTVRKESMNLKREEPDELDETANRKAENVEISQSHLQIAGKLYAKMLHNIVRQENIENDFQERKIPIKDEPEKFPQLSLVKARESIFNKNFNPTLKKKIGLNPLVKPRLIFDSSKNKFHRVQGGRQAIVAFKSKNSKINADKNVQQKLLNLQNGNDKVDSPLLLLNTIQSNVYSLKKSKLIIMSSSFSSLSSNNDPEDMKIPTEVSIHNSPRDLATELNYEISFLTTHNPRNIVQANMNTTVYNLKGEEAPSRFKKPCSFFSESKNCKKGDQHLMDAKLTKNINLSLLESKNYGKNICAKINHEVSNVIMQSKIARRRLCKELLNKTKEFLIFFKSLNLAKEYLFTFPLRPFFHPKSRIFFEAVKLGNVGRVKEMHASVNRLLVYEFDYLHQTGVHIAAKKNDEAMLATLIELGGYAGSIDIFNRSPLYYAIENKNPNIVYRLLVHNASPWSTKGCNYIELARDNYQIKYYIKQFRLLSIMMNMNSRSNRETLRQQFIATKIKAPKLFNLSH